MKKLLPLRLTSLAQGFTPHRSGAGFTLIELIVVITIIAFLAIIGMVSFTAAQAQARDGRRRADIDAIATAMEANKDPLGTYPTFDANIFADGKVPTDPINGTYNTISYVYATTATAATYITCARLEKGNGNFSDAGTTTASGASAVYYCRKSQQ